MCLFITWKAKLQILKGEIHIWVHNVLGDKQNCCLRLFRNVLICQCLNIGYYPWRVVTYYVCQNSCLKKIEISSMCFVYFDHSHAFYSNNRMCIHEIIKYSTDIL